MHIIDFTRASVQSVGWNEDRDFSPTKRSEPPRLFAWRETRSSERQLEALDCLCARLAVAPLRLGWTQLGIIPTIYPHVKMVFIFCVFCCHLSVRVGSLSLTLKSVPWIFKSSFIPDTKALLMLDLSRSSGDCQLWRRA